MIAKIKQWIKAPQKVKQLESKLSERNSQLITAAQNYKSKCEEVTYLEKQLAIKSVEIELLKEFKKVG